MNAVPRDIAAKPEFGIRWPAGHVTTYSSRSAAGQAITHARVFRRIQGAELVTREPGGEWAPINRSEDS